MEFSRNVCKHQAIVRSIVAMVFDAFCMLYKQYVILCHVAVAPGRKVSGSLEDTVFSTPELHTWLNFPFLKHF